MDMIGYSLFDVKRKIQQNYLLVKYFKDDQPDQTASKMCRKLKGFSSF